MPFVYPVAGRWLAGVPAVPHDCDDDRCLVSGAFTADPPHQPPEEADQQPEDPPVGGSSDSEA